MANQTDFLIRYISTGAATAKVEAQAVGGALLALNQVLVTVPTQMTKVNVGSSALSTALRNVGERALITIPIWMALREAFMGGIRAFDESVKSIVDIDTAMKHLEMQLVGTANAAGILSRVKGSAQSLALTTGESPASLIDVYNQLFTTFHDGELAYKGMNIAAQAALVTNEDSKDITNTLVNIYNELGASITAVHSPAEKFNYIMTTMTVLMQKNHIGIKDFEDSLKTFAGEAKLSNLTLDQTLSLVAAEANVSQTGQLAGRGLSGIFRQIQSQRGHVEELLGKSTGNQSDWQTFLDVLNKIQSINPSNTAGVEAITKIFSLRGGGQAIRALAAEAHYLTDNLKELYSLTPDERQAVFAGRLTVAMAMIQHQAEMTKQAFDALGRSFIEGLAGTDDYAGMLSNLNKHLDTMGDSAKTAGQQIRVLAEALAVAVPLAAAFKFVPATALALRSGFTSNVVGGVNASLQSLSPYALAALMASTPYGPNVGESLAEKRALQEEIAISRPTSGFLAQKAAQGLRDKAAIMGYDLKNTIAEQDYLFAGGLAASGGSYAHQQSVSGTISNIKSVANEENIAAAIEKSRAAQVALTAEEEAFATKLATVVPLTQTMAIGWGLAQTAAIGFAKSIQIAIQGLSPLIPLLAIIWSYMHLMDAFKENKNTNKNEDALLAEQQQSTFASLNRIRQAKGLAPILGTQFTASNPGTVDSNTPDILAATQGNTDEKEKQVQMEEELKSLGYDKIQILQYELQLLQQQHAFGDGLIEQGKLQLELAKQVNEEKKSSNLFDSDDTKLFEIAKKYGTSTAQDIGTVLQDKSKYDILNSTEKSIFAKQFKSYDTSRQAYDFFRGEGSQISINNLAIRNQGFDAMTSLLKGITVTNHFDIKSSTPKETAQEVMGHIERSIRTPGSSIGKSITYSIYGNNYDNSTIQGQ